MGSEKKRLFDGKVAVITASTQGIGFAIARRLALEGASVVISSRRQVSPIFSLSRQTADRAETFPPFFLSFLSERSLPSCLEELIAQSSSIAVGSSCCYFPSVLLYACHAFFFFAFLVPALVATTELPVIISIFEGILLLFALLSICLPPCPPSLVLQFC